MAEILYDNVLEAIRLRPGIVAAATSTGGPGSWLEFLKKVRPEGDWDYKSNVTPDHPLYEELADFGNLNFGLVSYWLGFDGSFTLLGIEAAAIAFDQELESFRDLDAVFRGRELARQIGNCMSGN